MLRITELALRDLIERTEQMSNDQLTDELKATRLKFINDLREAGKWVEDNSDLLQDWGNSDEE
jgi:hypothetical protein